MKFTDYMKIRTTIGAFEECAEYEVYENLAQETDADFFRLWEKEMNCKEHDMIA